MGVFVVVLFTLPLFIAFAVVSVKLLEFALNRDIASAKSIARVTTLAVVGVAVACGVAWLLYLLAYIVHGDSS